MDEPGGEEAAMLADARPASDDAVGQVLRAKVMQGLLGAGQPPPKIGRFVVLQRVGAGAWGTVFSAYDDVLDRRVAIKVLRAAEGGADLLPEARVLAKLRHPNVVAVHEAGEAGGQAYVAMEFVEGGNLRDWLQERAPSIQGVLELLIAAGRGLAAAHAAGIAHGDFKPDNILVGPDGPRVADFGLAASTRAPSSGSGGGSPAYMAPERLGGGPPSEAADQFALAVTLVEALGGERPFCGASAEQLRRSMAEAPTLPSSVRGNPRLSAAVRRALRADPSARFPSVEAFLEALTPAPTRHFVRWALALGTVAAVAGITVAGSEDTGPCDAGPSLLAAAYGAEQAEEVRAVLEGQLGPPLAVSTVERLDGYAAAWTQTHRDACTATRIEGVQSDTMLDRRMQCLMRRRTELGAALDALGTIQTPAEAARAVELVDALVDPRRCDAGTEVPPAPAADESQDVERLRAALAGAWANYRLARYETALGEARSIDEVARTLVYVPIQAEAALLLGTTQGRRAGFEEAEASLRRARLLAARARLPSLAADSSTQLLRTVMFAGDPARVADLSTHARADAIEAERDEAEVDGIVGESRLKGGDAAAALEAIERALKQEERAPQRALLLVNRASAKLQTGDAAGALADYQAAHGLAASHYGETHPRLGFFAHRVGRGQVRAGKLDDGLRTLERVLARSEALLGPNDRAVASVLVDLAEARIATEQPKTARGLLERALRIRTETLGPEHPRTLELVRRIGDL